MVNAPLCPSGVEDVNHIDLEAPCAAHLTTVRPVAAGRRQPRRPARPCQFRQTARQPPTYFALQPLAGDRIRRNARRGHDPRRPGSRPRTAFVDAQQSEHYSAFAQVLMTYTAGMPRGVAPDLTYLGGKMQDAADKVLGRKGSKVLLGSGDGESFESSSPLAGEGVGRRPTG